MDFSDGCCIREHVVVLLWSLSTTTTKILDANLPGAVKGRNGISIFLGMGQQLHQVVTGDDTGRDNIGAAHGERKVEGITIRESVVEIYFWIWFL